MSQQPGNNNRWRETLAQPVSQVKSTIFYSLSALHLITHIPAGNSPSTATSVAGESPLFTFQKPWVPSTSSPNRISENHVLYRRMCRQRSGMPSRDETKGPSTTELAGADAFGIIHSFIRSASPQVLQPTADPASAFSLRLIVDGTGCPNLKLVRIAAAVRELECVQNIWRAVGWSFCHQFRCRIVIDSFRFLTFIRDMWKVGPSGRGWVRELALTGKFVWDCYRMLFDCHAG